MVRKECEELRSSLQNAEQELDDVRVELTSTKKKIITFERESENKENTAEKVDDVQKLRAQVSVLQAEVEAANKKAALQEGASEKYVRDIEQKVKQLEKIRTEKDGLVEENSKLRQEVIGLTLLKALLVTIE